MANHNTRIAATLGGISMERRDAGRLTNTPSHGRLLLWTLAYTLAAFVLLSMHGKAFAAQLVDIRVGEHRGYTRIVLELDSLAAYQVAEPRDGEAPVMRVELDARSKSQELNPSHPIVESIRVESNGPRTAIHIQLEKAEVQINEMILLSPPRLVFDFRDPNAVVAKTAASLKQSAVVPKTAVAPKLHAAPTVELAKTTAAQKPASSVVETHRASATPQPSPASPDNARSSKSQDKAPAVVEAVKTSTPALMAATDFDHGEVAVAPHASEPAEATASAAQAPGHPLGLDGAATGRPNALAVPASPRPMASGTLGGRSVPPLPSQRRASKADAKAESAPGGMVARAKGFVGGINKMILAGAGVVVALLLFFVVRRGRDGDDALSPVMAADHLGGDRDDLFGGPGGAATEPVPVAPTSASAVPTPPSAAQGGGSLETRVAQLESTLAQLAQARENMERQLAAQTEELRVQRAAIARTQRVVRSFGEGEEDSSGATEPVPRVPAS